ncbi:MAG TPA: amidohydrolase [Thermomicrobiales bacterium]|nr:amidohydrolase [Thermomicrobiales bacterium]HRA46498.1 amidohydrolase [Thermomicrobiales bacterium]
MSATLEALHGTVDEMLPGVVADRRWLHQHPELGYQEHKTAAFIAERLTALGVEDIRTGVGGTGVIGLIHGGLGAGKVVGIRADMDALPILEENEVDYISTNPGTMHACGHDGHVAMLLGTARALIDLKATFAGTVKLFFQPAEEGGAGASAMIRDGALNDPRPDGMLGIHLWNTLPVGHVYARNGAMMVGGDGFTITIHGAGGHGALPNICIDPIVAGAALITALQTVVSRSNNPLNPGVVTVGTIHSGHASNVIPDTLTFGGTIRFVDEEQRLLMRKRLTEIAESTAAAFGARAEVDLEWGVGPTVNDPAMVSIVRDAAAAVVGPENATAGDLLMVSEDMSEFLNEVPGCYYLVGSGNEARGLTWGHHTSRFDIDEDALGIGIETMTRSALSFLSS